PDHRLREVAPDRSVRRAGREARLLVSPRGRRRDHRRGAPHSGRTQRRLRLDRPQGVARDRDPDRPGLRPEISPARAAAARRPAFQAIPREDALMDFIRRWLVGRDLKRGAALEGEGYYEQAMGAYEEALEFAVEKDRARALRQFGSCALRLGKLA